MTAIKTGGSTNVGVPRNKQGLPTIYIEKRYPIEGRQDFFKWVIVTPEGLAKNWKGDEMWLDSYEQARDICRAVRRASKG